MEYLSTTGNRLHDLELDRMIARLSALEAKGGATSTTTPAITQTITSSVVAGLRSITPGSGTQMSNDISLAAVGSLTLSQASNTITFTAPVLVAGTNITLTPAGNNITVSATGGSAGVPAHILAIAPGSAAISWAVPLALTEFNGLTIYRGKHDLTNATQARIVISYPTGLAVPVSPTFAVQYSTNNGSTWAYLDAAAGPNVGYGPGVQAGAYVTITALAKADVQIRVVGSGGDGATSVPIGLVTVQVK